ncbi:hypothetical protein [Chiayiivirga flava]|uniref:IPTL-CTERM protein sorting domain-containing protein n=1 Tax=Chiayiivirga flava TaxID=659595 RepID=A0A7W8G051_9GAMM|nr:hypothetical protein [Chiayiivirga flava]MBB5209152.1 hypothetical protein [Chiayiivirga flava]
MNPCLRLLQVLGLMVSATAAHAAIVVTPPAPLPGQPVRIALVEQYTSAAAVTSASITRDGNGFVIEQAVEVTCALPAAPVLTSSFDVGSLAPGDYEVVANIVRTPTTPDCIVENATQEATFSIASQATASSPAIVPVSGPAGLAALATLLAMLAAFRIRHASAARRIARK